MRKNISISTIVTGILCILIGFDGYSKGWSSKYQQPVSELGAIALIAFGIILLVIELVKYLKSKSNK
jgi:uncharacterized membrane protein YidH (DUF202 family)